MDTLGRVPAGPGQGALHLPPAARITPSATMLDALGRLVIPRLGNSTHAAHMRSTCRAFHQALFNGISWDTVECSLLDHMGLVGLCLYACPACWRCQTSGHAQR